VLIARGSRIRVPVPVMLLVLVTGMLSITAASASAAGWLEPEDISAANEVVDGRPHVAVDAAGNAVAIWERHVGGEEIVEATERPAGGEWSEPEVLTLPGEEGEQSQVAIDASGNAIAVWVTGDLATDFVVRSAVRPPGGEWSGPEDVSDSIEGVFPSLAVDAAGEAVAVWTAFGASSFIVQGAVRSADGVWSEPDDLSDEGVTPLEAPDVAIDASGNAIAVWKLLGANHIVQAAVRPAGGDWEEPDDLSAPGQEAGEPAVTMNEAGEAVAVWTRLDGIDTIQAATRPADGDWTAPDDLSNASQNAGEPGVAIDEAGEAVAVWGRFDGSNFIAQAAVRPAGGEWGEPDELSTPGQSAVSPVVAMNVAVGAVAMWYRDNGANFRVQATVRPPGGEWPKPDTLSAAGEGAAFPEVALDAAGNAFAVFGRNGAGGPAVQATGYDFVAPRLSDLRIPATGTVGEPVIFGVSSFDVFPFATSWTFGDGGSGAGNTVSHVYTAPGAYPVTVSAVDGGGNTSTQIGAIAITAATPKPPPLACTVPKLVGKKLARAKAALRAADCKVGKVQRPKRKGKRRRPLVVKSSSPAAGAQPADGTVDLRLGPKPRKARR
jgi:hypothetical protein